MKPYIFREAGKFVMNLNEYICDEITHNHRKLVEQFLNHKERTQKRLEGISVAEEKIMMLESRLAIETPAFEGEYAIDDRTSLSLFDCLIPKLKEHRRFKIKPDDAFSINDFKL